MASAWRLAKLGSLVLIVELVKGHARQLGRAGMVPSSSPAGICLAARWMQGVLWWGGAEGTLMQHLDVTLPRDAPSFLRHGLKLACKGGRGPRAAGVNLRHRGCGFLSLAMVYRVWGV